MIKIVPSILAADVLQLGREAQKMLQAGADWLHVDVMDGHFVPNISYGPSIVAGLHTLKEKPYLDVHLMISEPEKYVEAFAKAGANSLTIHCEAEGNIEETLRRIRSFGISSEISVKPKTPVAAIESLLPLVDMVLIMTVEPGFGGQSFMADMLDKVRILREQGYTGDIQVDGGVNQNTALACIQAGANVLVMGTGLYRAEDPARLIADLKGVSSV